MVHKDQSCLSFFFSLFFELFHQGGSFTELVKKTLEVSPCTPNNCWELIFYSDEIVPGQFLQTDSSRKVQAVYVSIKQFGGIALSHEESWLLGMAKGSSQVNELEASMSQVTAIYLSSIFENNMVDACNCNTGFVVKDEHDVSYRIHLKLGMLLQDGAAHKTIYSLEGDAGTKFCIFCANLYKGKSNITMEDNEQVLVPRIVNSVSYVTRISHEIHFSWQAQYLVIFGVSLYVFADCKVSIVAVNKIPMCAFATFVSLCGPQE